MPKNRTIERIDWETVTWVVNNLSPIDLEVVKKTKSKVLLKTLIDFVDRECENGGDFKFGWDAYGDCPTVKLIYTAKGNENTGFALSARGENFVHCLRILLYKFGTVANGKLHELRESRDAPNYG